MPHTSIRFGSWWLIIEPSDTDEYMIHLFMRSGGLTEQPVAREQCINRAQWLELREAMDRAMAQP